MDSEEDHQEPLRRGMGRGRRGKKGMDTWKPEAEATGQAIVVKGTGDLSSDSKLSAIQNGYWKDPWFETLNNPDNSKRPNRTSLICRGYHVRFRVCDYFLKKLMNQMDSAFQLVSLGCGMDSTFFRYATEFGQKCTFYDVDFSSVIWKKQRALFLEPVLTVKKYEGKIVLVPGDLRDLNNLEEAFSNNGLNFNLPTIFYSECVVNYLKPEENNAILRWIVAKFSKPVWLAYEQCLPNDSFGRVMVDHFERQGCPLLAIERYDDMESQLEQLQNAGFKSYSVLNVWDIYQRIARPLNNAQQFDEFEAFVATCCHYSVRLASVSPLPELMTFPRETATATPLKFASSNWHHLVTGHATAFSGTDAMNKVLLIGGIDANSRRRLSSALFEIPTLYQGHDRLCSPTVIAENDVYERILGCAVYAPKSDSYYVFGGRKSPNYTLESDMVKLEIIDGSMTTTSPKESEQRKPLPRWRHSMVCFNYEDDEMDFIFLMGGKTKKGALYDCWTFNTGSAKWIRLCYPPGVTPSSRYSHSMCNDPSRTSIFIIGGINSEAKDLSFCKDPFWQYNYQNDTWTKWDLTDLAVKRFGHTTHLYRNHLFIVGGLSSCLLDHFLVMIDLETRAESFFKLVLQPRQSFLPFGFSSVLDVDKATEKPTLFVFGGGGNCFSFGTHMNRLILEIDLPL